MALFNSESQSTNQTTNYADSFNKSSSLTYAPTNTGGNITVNLTPDPPTGNAAIDGLVKFTPIFAIGIIAWAFMRR